MQMKRYKYISDLGRNPQCEPASSWLTWTRLINFSVHLLIHLFRGVNPRLWLLVSTPSLNQSPRITQQQQKKTSGRQKDKKREPLHELNSHYSSQAQHEEGSECSSFRKWSRQKQSSGEITWVVQPWGGFSPSQKALKTHFLADRMPDTTPISAFSLLWLWPPLL